MSARRIYTWVLVAALIAWVITVTAVTLATPAGATEPRTTFTVSPTQVVVTYAAGADSIDVNIRYADGSSFNVHPNRAAAVGEVLTIPVTSQPVWVQVHTTDCHWGEPGSPGYGIDCRAITPEEPPSASPSPSATTGPSEPTPRPSEPTPTSSQEPPPSATAMPTTPHHSEVSAIDCPSRTVSTVTVTDGTRDQQTRAATDAECPTGSSEPTGVVLAASPELAATGAGQWVLAVMVAGALVAVGLAGVLARRWGR